MTRAPSKIVVSLLARLDALASGLISGLVSTAGLRFARGPVAGLALVLLAAAVYLPGLMSIPAVDRDEARFAQASRQMFESQALRADQLDSGPFEIIEQSDGSARVTVGLHSGGLAVPVLGHKPRLNKPPLIYWLQSASAAIFTGGDPSKDAIWMYRVPSVLSALLTVLITWRLGCSMLDPRAAWLGAVLLAVSPMVIWDAHQARADQLLLTTTVLAIWPLWLIFKHRAAPSTELARAKTWGTPLWLAVAIALGVLAKGPISPMIVATTALACSVAARDFRWLLRLRPVLLVCVVGVMVGPWVYAVAQKVGFSAFLDIVFDETLGRSTSAKEGHWGPPGYHLVLSAVLFWPGSLLTAAAVLGACRSALVFPQPAHPAANKFARLLLLPARIRARVIGDGGGTSGGGGELFLLAWLIPAWVIFELISTKLPHYTMPLYPAMALLTGHLLFAVLRSPFDAARHKKLLLGFRLWLVLGAVLTVGLPLASLLTRPTLLASIAAIGTAAVCLLLLRIAWRAISQNNIARAQLVSIAALFVFVVPTFMVTLPGAKAAWITPRLVDVLDTLALNWRDRPIAAVNFHEDSFMFASRGRLERLPRLGAELWLIENPEGLIVSPETHAPPNAEKISKVPVRGYNYASGDAVELFVWKLNPASIEGEEGRGGRGGAP